MKKKVLSLAPLSRTVARLKRLGRRVVFTNGCFDLLHAGHVRYLEKAKSLGDILVVALNSDASVRALKGGGRPLQRQADRACVLAAIEAVDFITVFSDRTPLRTILTLKPDVLVKGADWKLEDIVGAREVKSWGGRVRRIGFLPGRSTSRLVKRALRVQAPA